MNKQERKEILEDIQNKDFLSVKETAAYLNSSETTIYNKLNNGVIKGKKMGGDKSNWLISKKKLKKQFGY